MQKINNLLLCVGAQKSGTTWLYEMLKMNANISFSDHKEIHYFDMHHNISNQLQTRIINVISKKIKTSEKNLIETLFDNKKEASVRISNLLNDEWYYKQFDHSRKYCADFTPEYALVGIDGYSHIKKVSKKQKVIFIMRDPIRRSLSAIQYFYQNRNIALENVPQDDLLLKANSSLIISRSQYHNTIDSLTASFDKEDILFLFYEDVMKQKEKHLEEIHKFLELKHTVKKSVSIEKKINSSEKFEFTSEVFNAIHKNLSSVKTEVKSRLGYTPDEWI